MKYALALIATVLSYQVQAQAFQFNSGPSCPPGSKCIPSTTGDTSTAEVKNLFLCSLKKYDNGNYGNETVLAQKSVMTSGSSSVNSIRFGNDEVSVLVSTQYAGIESLKITHNNSNLSAVAIGDIFGDQGVVEVNLVDAQSGSIFNATCFRGFGH